MKNHFEDVNNHSIHSNYKLVSDVLYQIDDEFQLDPNAHMQIVCIRFVLEQWEKMLNSCPKELVSITQLNRVDTAISNIVSSLKQFISTQDYHFLEMTDEQLDVIRNDIHCIGNFGQKQPDDLNQAYQSYVSYYVDKSIELQDRYTELENKLDELQNIIDVNNLKNQSELSSLQNDVQNERIRLDAFATSYQQQMNNDQQNYNKMIQVFNEDFKTNVDNWENKITKQIDECQRELQNFQKERTEEAVAAESDRNNVIEEYRTIFNEYQEEVRNIVGIVNTNMFSAKYKQVADDAKKRAKHWQILAVILMLCVAAFAIYAFVATTNNDTNWVKLVAKLLATGTLATAGAYAAAQATKQEKVERYARKIEMELVAIDPFIEKLDEDSKNKIKHELAMRIFNEPDDMGVSKHSEWKKKETSFEFEKLISLMSKMPNE